MKRILGFAAIAGVALAMATAPASAFNKRGHYGGSAKAFSMNAASAYGKVWGKVRSYGPDRELEIENESNQYNETFIKKEYGSKTVGGISGSINTIDRGQDHDTSDSDFDYGDKAAGN